MTHATVYTLHIGPVDWLCRYLAGEPVTWRELLLDLSPWTVVPIHPDQSTWLGAIPS